jgi:quercetin dioxygenase-like cupin family protein
MKIIRLAEVPKVPVEMEGVRAAFKQVPIGKRDGAPTMSLRVFTIAQGGHTPHHAHAFEHINYVISGRGELLTDAGSRPIAAGDFILVLPDERHQYRNAGKEPLVFACLVPTEYE